MMRKSAIFVFVILLIITSSITFAREGSIASFVNDLMTKETWVNSQMLSYDEIRYKNDPEFKTPPTCSYDRVAATISNDSNLYILNTLFGTSKKLKVVFYGVNIPIDESTNDPKLSGTRNKDAASYLKLNNEKVEVDGYLNRSKTGDRWELFINGNEIKNGEYWIIYSFIFDGEEYVALDKDYIGLNAKICSSFSQIDTSASSSSATANTNQNPLTSNKNIASSYNRKEEYIIFDHKADYHVEITSNKYDVTKSIPTSEKVTTSGWVDNADYYIKARTTTYNAEANGVNFKATVSYDWGKYEKVDGVNTWKSLGSDEVVVSESNYSVSTEPVVYYDVPVSNTAILTGGRVNASDGKYSIGDYNIPAANLVGSTASNINFVENYVDIPKEYTLTGSVGGAGKYSSASEARSAATASANSMIAAKKYEIVQILLHGLTADQNAVNYRFCGLKVNKNGISGAPDTR